jgi:polyisoprenoid-binding protein YceI
MQVIMSILRPIRRIVLFALLTMAGVAWAAILWRMEPTASQLTFVGKQAGAEFTGKFERFTADIHFDPEDLANSKFIVDIDVATVNSKDKERDDILKGNDLFNVKRWPKARYVAETITAKGDDKFSATGKLTIRDVTRDVPIEFAFTLDPAGKNAWLKGGAALKRLDFGVGQGEWKDTQWVSNDVRVEFALRLAK